MAGSLGLVGLMEPLLVLLRGESQPHWAWLATVSVQAATTQGPFQLVQERYKSMTNICNLKIGQSFAII